MLALPEWTELPEASQEAHSQGLATEDFRISSEAGQGAAREERGDGGYFETLRGSLSQ